MTESIDVAALGRYLESFIDEFNELKSAEKFPGGQSNPTYKLTAESGNYVLRRKPPGVLLKSAHAVDREYRLLTALEGSKVPVGKTYHLCTNENIIGSIFYVMEYLEGDVHWSPKLPEMTNAQRAVVYDQLNKTLADIHSVDIHAVGLSDYGKPGAYFERQINRWTKQYRAAELDPIESMEKLIVWLSQNQPADDGRVALVHGDYRLDNLMFYPGDTRPRAVMDWELSTLGHPYSDLAYQCMQWRLDDDPISKGLGNINRSNLGIPTEDEYIAAYCQRTGIEKIEHWNFYLAFSFFRLAAITQGIMKRAIDGNASSKKAMQVGRMTKPLAIKACELIG